MSEEEKEKIKLTNNELKAIYEQLSEKIVDEIINKKLILENVNERFEIVARERLNEEKQNNNAINIETEMQRLNETKRESIYN